MKSSKKTAFYSNLIATVCIVIIDLTALLEYLTTGDPGGILSSICLALGSLCIVIAWISYFRSRKK